MLFVSKIKEIRKILSPIKEIEKKKVESLDDEVTEEEPQEFVNFEGLRKFTKAAEVHDLEAPTDIQKNREERIAKEDKEEINFRASYNAVLNNYQSNPYTSESGVKTKSFAERPFDQDNPFKDQNGPRQQQSGGEITPERNYVGEQDSRKNRRRDSF